MAHGALRSALEAVDGAVAALERDVRSGSPPPLSDVVDRATAAVRALVVGYVEDSDAKKPPGPQAGLLDAFRVLVKGDPAWNAIRDNCRELVYYRNCIDVNAVERLPPAADRMAARLARHVFLYVKTRGIREGRVGEQALNNAVSRQRGVEHDIIQRPETSDLEPYYEPQGKEIAIFEAAARRKLPVMLKGPTGCGKTRFLEHMAWRLKRPLVTVSCHEDLTSSDLVGRFLLEGAQTVWQDGPLTRAVKAGAICYLDEIVEARTDSTVVIHSLTDHRRKLTLEKKGQEIDAHDDFLLVISYNPGYQTVLKDLKPSTKQRFVALNFDFPIPEVEKRILMSEVPGLSAEMADKLVAAGGKARGLKDHGLDEVTSTRALVYAANLISAGLAPVEACTAAMVSPITDDIELSAALSEIIRAHFE